MSNVIALDPLKIFYLFVIPGLVSIKTLRMLLPDRSTNWFREIVEGTFFSGLNFLLFSWLISLVTTTNAWHTDTVAFVAAVIAIIFLGPMCWPILDLRIFGGTVIADDTFVVSEPKLARVCLADGTAIGGYFGANSYLHGSGSDGTLYLEKTHSITDDGEIGAEIEGSEGVVIQGDEYSRVEFFTLEPNSTEGENSE